MLQGGGRDAEVPGLALRALRRLAAAPGDSDGDGCATVAAAAGVAASPELVVPACQLMLLAIKALWRAGRAADVPALVAKAAAALPALAPEFENLAARVAAQLAACEAGGGAALLASARFASCVDLAGVSGRHHDGSPGLESADPIADEGMCPLPA